jgi:hypothetical protein
MVLDEAIYRLEEVAEQGVEFLGIDRTTERRVAHEIGKEHGHLSPLALVASRGWRSAGGDVGRRPSLDPQRGDRPEQLLAMAE